MARLLLMEDDRVLGLELAGALKEAGHEVVICTSATEARDALWHWDFDLLLTDMVVRKGGKPVPDGGLGLISWVRHTAMTTEGLDHLPVIAISGEQASRGMGFLLPTADRLGADMVIEKPIDMPKLLRAIVSIVDTHCHRHNADDLHSH